MDDICARQLAANTGMQGANFISYKSALLMMAELIAGRADVACVLLPVAKPQIANGGIKALAVTLPFVSSQLPGVPTLESAGIQGVIRGFWHVLVAPRAVSASAMEPMVSAIRHALSDSSVTQRLQELGIDVVRLDDVSPEIAENFLRRQSSFLEPYGKLR